MGSPDSWISRILSIVECEVYNYTIETAGAMTLYQINCLCKGSKQVKRDFIREQSQVHLDPSKSKEIKLLQGQLVKAGKA